MTVKLIGTTNEGATNLPATIIYYSKFNCDISGNCTELRVFPKVNTNVRGAIYSDNGGHPNILIDNVQSGSIAVATGAWRAVALSAGVALVAGTDYWLAVQVQVSGGTGYDVSAVQNEYEAQAYGVFPAIATPTEQDAVLISLQGWGTVLAAGRSFGLILG